MKKIIYITLTLFMLVVMSMGCKRELDSEGVSRITYFPELKMSGDLVETVIVGTTYTEPGVKAYENGKEITVTITGSVDSQTPGAYVLTYTATNKDGYSASMSRMVGVITSEAATDDLSGSYQRNAGAQGVAVWTKIKDGVYLDSDVGGAKLAASVYVFNIKKDIIVVPHQPLSGGGSDTYCTNADGSLEIPFTNGTVGTICYKWVVINSGYGLSLRSFVKVN